MPIDHEFGDQHTELKLSIVEKYLKFFTTALRGKFKELWYIDAFAGTGSRTVRHEERAAGLLDSGEPERIERRRGSARIAIDIKPPFDFIVLSRTSLHTLRRCRNWPRTIPIGELPWSKMTLTTP